MGKSAPKPPDPQETAAAQMNVNMTTSQMNNVMGMVGQQTPYGSLNYKQAGSERIYDAANGRYVNVPRYKAIQKFTPEGQAILDQQMGAQLGMATLANDQTARLRGIMDTPFSPDTEAVEGRLMDLGRSRLDPALDRRREAMTQRLADQGITLGSAAYDRAMGGLNESENDAYNQLMLTGRAQAMNEAYAERNQPMNEVAALMSGSQLRQPNFVNTPTNPMGTPDLAGMTYASYDGERANWAAQQQMMGGLFGGIAQGIAMSDRRFKQDVEEVGQIGPLTLYEYAYTFAPNVRTRGLMADEVREVLPEAVQTIGGIDHVDYDAVREAFA